MLPIKSFTNILRNIAVGVKTLNKKYLLQRCSYSTSSDNDKFDNQKSLGEIGTKYQIFQDKDADIILDVYEEKLKYHHLLEDKAANDEEDPLKGINLESML